MLQDPAVFSILGSPFQLGFIFTPLLSNLSGTPTMPTLPSVALWNHGSRLHDLFHLSSLIPAKPISCGQCCQLTMGLAFFNHSCSGYCVLTLEEHFLGSFFEREPFPLHPQLRLFFLMDLQFHKMEALTCGLLPSRPLSSCPNAECHVSF